MTSVTRVVEVSDKLQEARDLIAEAISEVCEWEDFQTLDLYGKEVRAIRNQMDVLTLKLRES